MEGIQRSGWIKKENNRMLETSQLFFLFSNHGVVLFQFTFVWDQEGSDMVIWDYSGMKRHLK